MAIRKWIERGLLQQKNAVRISLHIVFWLALTAIQAYLLIISFNPYKDFPGFVLIANLLSGTLSVIAFYYPLVYFVIPKLILRKKTVLSIFAILVLVCLYAGLDTLRETYILEPCASCMKALKVYGSGYEKFIQQLAVQRWILKLLTLGTFINLVFSIALPLSIKWGLQALRQQMRTAQLEKANLQLEFDFLRAQVNPHFLFNTLNNIYGQVLNDKKEIAASLVARLSNVLRYTLYESTTQSVDMDKEIEFLRDYAQLESVRLNHTKVNFSYNTDHTIKHMPPLLLVPVIENAFKYCDDNAGARIDINVIVHNHKLDVSVQNKINPFLETGSTGGIGQDNFRKRLHLYYPGRHTVHMERKEDVYSVAVKITGHE